MDSEEAISYELSSARYVYHCGSEGSGVSIVLDSVIPANNSEWIPLTDALLSKILDYRGTLQNGALWGPGLYVGSKKVAAKYKSAHQPICYEFYLPAKISFLDLAAYDFEFIDAEAYDMATSSTEISDHEPDLAEEFDIGLLRSEYSNEIVAPVFSRGHNPKLASEKVRKKYVNNQYDLNARVTGIAETKYDVFYVLRSSSNEMIRYRKIPFEAMVR